MGSDGFFKDDKAIGGTTVKGIALAEVNELKADTKKFLEILDGIQNKIKKMDSNKGISRDATKIGELETLADKIDSKTHNLQISIVNLDYASEKINDEIHKKLAVIVSEIKPQFEDLIFTLTDNNNFVIFRKSKGLFHRGEAVRVGELVAWTAKNEIKTRFAIINDQALDYIKSRIIFLVQRETGHNPELVNGPIASGASAG